MVAKIIHLALIAIVFALLGAHSSSSTPNETEKLIELTERLDRLQNKVETLESENIELTERLDTLQTKVATLESENEMLTTRFDDLKMENSELKSDVKELKVQVSKQDEEISLLKSHVTNLEPLLAPNRDSNDGTNPSSNKNNGPSVRSLSGPPSSCQELKDKSNSFMPIDGIHLLKNKSTKKIEAAFCTFPSSYSTTDQTVSQHVIGQVDVKTETVHFYVQKDSSFGLGGQSGVIPFELARLNVGNAFNLALGTFTVPVAGIYHFDFSAVKSDSLTNLDIWLQVNGANVGIAWAAQYATYDVVSLSASFRLAKGDRVNLYNGYGLLYDDGTRHTHFTGWLVEEELM